MKTWFCLHFNGLPGDFEAFITTVEFQSETLTFSDLHAKLLLHEQRVFDYHNPGFSIAHDVAFSVKFGGQNHSGVRSSRGHFGINRG